MKIEVADLTGAECGDIAITAAEGGIGYWSQIESYDWSRWSVEYTGVNKEVADDFVFYRLAPLESDGGDYDWDRAVDITPALLRLGLKRMYEADTNKGGWAGRQILEAMVNDREEFIGDIDSDLADMIVQFGVFGELVYG